MWHKQFAVKFIPELTEVLRECLCYVNKEATDTNKHQVPLGLVQEDGFDAGAL